MKLTEPQITVITQRIQLIVDKHNALRISSRRTDGLYLGITKTEPIRSITIYLTYEEETNNIHLPPAALTLMSNLYKHQGFNISLADPQLFDKIELALIEVFSLYAYNTTSRSISS